MLLALWIVLALGVAILLYAMFIERNWYAVRRHRIPCLPQGSSTKTILHLSDLHLRAPQRRKRAFLQGLARVEPDYVIATGDFIGDARSNAETVDAVAVIRPRA